MVQHINPAEIHIGRENHGNKLPEPSEEDLMRLVAAFEVWGKGYVHLKTLGPAWWEKF